MPVVNGGRVAIPRFGLAGGRVFAWPEALFVTAVSAVVPGFAHLRCGRRRAGLVLLGLYEALAVSGGLLATGLSRVLPSADRDFLIAVGPGFLAAAWVVLVLVSYRAVRPCRPGLPAQAAAGAAVAALCVLVAAIPPALAWREGLHGGLGGDGRSAAARRPGAGSDLVRGVPGGTDAHGRPGTVREPGTLGRPGTADGPGALGQPGTAGGPAALGGRGGAGGVYASGWAEPYGSARVNLLLVGRGRGARAGGLALASVDARTGDTVLLLLPGDLRNVPVPGVPSEVPLASVYRYGVAHPGRAGTSGGELLEHAVGVVTGIPVDRHRSIGARDLRRIVAAGRRANGCSEGAHLLAAGISGTRRGHARPSPALVALAAKVRRARVGGIRLVPPRSDHRRPDYRRLRAAAARAVAAQVPVRAPAPHYDSRIPGDMCR